MRISNSKFYVLVSLVLLFALNSLANIAKAHAQIDPRSFICREHINSAFSGLTLEGMPRWLQAIFEEGTGEFIGYAIQITEESAPLIRNALNMAYNNVYADQLYLGTEYNSVEKMNELLSSWTDEAPDEFNVHWLYVSDFRFCNDDDFWNSGKTIYDAFASREPIELLPVAAIVILLALLGLHTWIRGFRGLTR